MNVMGVELNDSICIQGIQQSSSCSIAYLLMIAAAIGCDPFQLVADDADSDEIRTLQ